MIKPKHIPKISQQWVSNYLSRKKLHQLKAELQTHKTNLQYLRRGSQKQLKGTLKATHKMQSQLHVRSFDNMRRNVFEHKTDRQNKQLQQTKRILATQALSLRMEVRLSTDSVRLLKKERHDQIRELNKLNNRKIAAFRQKDGEYKRKLRKEVISDLRQKEESIRQFWESRLSTRNVEMQVEGTMLKNSLSQIQHEISLLKEYENKFKKMGRS